MQKRRGIWGGWSLCVYDSEVFYYKYGYNYKRRYGWEASKVVEEMGRKTMNRDEVIWLNERVRELEKKVAYLEGVLYMLLMSLPLLVMLILRAFLQFLPLQHLFWFKERENRKILLWVLC